MISAPLSVHENARLEALRSYHILDTPPEQAYDDFTLLASRICDTPIALISLLDADRQWFKSKVGLAVDSTQRSISFCGHTVDRPGELLEVDDALTDERFHDNPLVQGDPNIRFYAGVPLVGHGRHVLGTLCVIDRQPRRLSADQRAALEALARQVTMQLELRAARETLSDRNTELERLHKENNQLAGMVAHDLRNPLQVIDGYGKLMLHGIIGPISDGQKTALEAVTRNCAFMLSLVNELLSLSHLNSGILDLDLIETDMARLVSANVELNRLLAVPKLIQIDLDVEKDLPHIRVDAFKIEQVLNNLISNAIKFSYPDTRIRVSLKKIGAFLQVEVSDQGQGIPDAEQARLFTPFGKTSVKSTGGETSTGLGLAIAKRMIEGHRGTIEVRSRSGEGSTFTINLPLIG
jgi:signal transduction histidine kinase